MKETGGKAGHERGQGSFLLGLQYGNSLSIPLKDIVKISKMNNNQQ
ncbi:MAG: hypothetical protein IKU11_03650 [Clostridia bacterium]|nr:hypothetical protein [Clostridia bacterium]